MSIRSQRLELIDLWSILFHGVYLIEQIVK